MGRLTEVFATVKDGFGTREQYSYLSVNYHKNNRVLMKMRHLYLLMEEKSAKISRQKCHE